MKTSKILSFDYLVNASDILIPVSDVISISLVENRLNFISRACRLLHTESFDTDEAAKTAFNTYARNFESNLPEEAVYRGNNCIARLKFVYGISLFQNAERAILTLTNRYGGTLVSESAKPDTLDEAFGFVE